jgi:hypothetical protein
MFEGCSVETKKNLIRLLFERTQRELDRAPAEIEVRIRRRRNTTGVSAVDLETKWASTTESRSRSKRPSVVRGISESWRAVRRKLIVDRGSGIIAKDAGGLAVGVRALGRGQVARHRVLVPGSQVRILPPQPMDSERGFVGIDGVADRSR